MGQLVKNLPTMWETRIQSLGWEDTLENGKATHSSILDWRIPWTLYSPWGCKESDTTEWLWLSLSSNIPQLQAQVWVIPMPTFLGSGIFYLPPTLKRANREMGWVYTAPTAHRKETDRWRGSQTRRQKHKAWQGEANGTPVYYFHGRNKKAEDGLQIISLGAKEQDQLQPLSDILHSSNL